MSLTPRADELESQYVGKPHGAEELARVYVLARDLEYALAEAKRGISEALAQREAAPPVHSIGVPMPAPAPAWIVEIESGGDKYWRCASCRGKVWCSVPPSPWGHEATCQHHPKQSHSQFHRTEEKP